MRTLSGEVIYSWMGCMLGSADPLHEEPLGDETNPFDHGAGWDQGVRMERGPPARPGAPTVSYEAPTYLNPGRWEGSSSEMVAPLLFRETLEGRFGSEVSLIEWAPDPAVQRSYGLSSPVIANQLPQVAKESIGPYDYSAYDSSAILEEAMARVRRTLYGR